MKQNILWYQSEKLGGDDFVVLNGKVFSNRIEGNIYFDKLKKTADIVIKNRSPWCGFVKGVYFVKGWFSAVDERGRQLPFMFISEEKDGYMALMHELKSLGYSLESRTEECVKKQSSKLPISMIVSFVVIILLIILIFSIRYGNK